MPAAAQKLLTAISALSESEQHLIAIEILRRSPTFEGSSISDEGLTAIAVGQFAELDQQEDSARP